MKPPACRSPLGKEILTAYWLGELPAPEEQTAEEHLLGCAECSAQLEELAATAAGVRAAARSGNLRLVLSPSLLDCAAREGLRVRQYAPARGGSVQCTVTAEDDWLVGRLAADLGGVERLDVCFCSPGGFELERLRDIPFNAARREVIFTHPVALAMSVRRPETLLVKLVSVTGAAERVIGEYTFHHTPS
jgi:hypothetical protein